MHDMEKLSMHRPWLRAVDYFSHQRGADDIKCDADNQFCELHQVCRVGRSSERLYTFPPTQDSSRVIISPEESKKKTDLIQVLVLHWPTEQETAVVAPAADREGLQVFLLPGPGHARDHARPGLLPRARSLWQGQVHQDHQEERAQGAAPKLWVPEWWQVHEKL